MTKALLTLTLGGALMIGGALPVAAQEKADTSGDKTFTNLDADRDGKLTIAEFGKRYEMEGKKTTDQERQKEFTAWDSDGDGSVSKSEFGAKHSAAKPQQPERIEQPQHPERIEQPERPKQ